MKYQPAEPDNPDCEGQQFSYIRSKVRQPDGSYKVDYGMCDECGHTKYIRDYRTGEKVCPGCGLVIDDEMTTEDVENPVLREMPYKTINKFTKDEQKFIHRNKLHLSQQITKKEYRQYELWNIINQYGHRLNVSYVDIQTVFSYMKNNDLSGLHCSNKQVALCLLRYVIVNRKHQNTNFTVGIFKEEGLDKDIYRKVIRHLYRTDKKFTLFRKEDVDKYYYRFIHT